MKILMFQPRFAPLVQSGAKRQTIRPVRKVPIKVGDELSLRAWTGKPYRSPQKILRDGEVCNSVEPFLIGPNPEQPTTYVAVLNYALLDLEKRMALAISDGFKDWNEMFLWFQETHGFPFYGTLIKW